MVYCASEPTSHVVCILIYLFPDLFLKKGASARPGLWLCPNTDFPNPTKCKSGPNPPARPICDPWCLVPAPTASASALGHSVTLGLHLGPKSIDLTICDPWSQLQPPGPAEMEPTFHFSDFEKVNLR